jgi:hypothetical protein
MPSFSPSRKLYPAEVAYIREIFGDSLNYDKIRVTKDHWLSYGSTRVVGNTVNFTSTRGGEDLFEDTPEQQLSPAGITLLGHEAAHVWQFQNGGWAYAGDSLAKQAAGFYSTGSRNTAYDWETAVRWGIPWERWGPEQQAKAIDVWDKATRRSASGRGLLGDGALLAQLSPFMEKVRRGEGAIQFSIPGAAVSSFIAGGIGYLFFKKKGVAAGVALGVLVNLPWNKWFLSKPGLARLDLNA